MPSSITHDLISKETIRLLPNGIAPMPKEAPDYYFLGSQGADFLFFYRPFSRRELNFGKYLHRYRVYELFSAMSNCLKTYTGETLEKARAYCLGYITHYSADVCFHPFVYHYLSAKKAKRSVHSLIENDWDVYFLRTREGREAEHYDYHFSPEKIADENILYNLFDEIARALGRRSIKKSALANALKNYNRYLKHFHGACYKNAGTFSALGLKALSRLYPRRNVADEFIEGREFLSFSGGQGKNADELFDKAVSDSARRIILFLASVDGAPLPREEFNRHLLTGNPTEE